MRDIPEITGMRGYASQAVIIFHFFAISSLLRLSWFSALPLAWNSGVDFFFVLSGFLLTIPFLESGRLHLKSYYVKRVFRILPLYYLSLGGTLLFFSQGATIQQIVTSIFFLQNFSPATFDKINGVYWTIVIEEIFYITLPIFSIFFRGDRWMYALPACVAISTAYRTIIGTIYYGNLYLENFYLWQYPSYIEHYAIGATLANFFVNRRIFEGKHTSKPLIGIIGLTIVSQITIGFLYPINGYNFPIANLVFALEYGGLIYYTLSAPRATWIRNLFTNRAASFAGKISYSTYVWHLPIEATIFLFNLPLALWIISSYALSIVISVASHYAVERPFLRLRNRFLPTRKINISRKKIVSPRIASD
ncbi:MAG: acyltransferase family protein [Nitrososphaerales archaeon]